MIGRVASLASHHARRAVAIDATLVRALLLPAMGLPGQRTWWARRVLARLRRRTGAHEALA